MKNNRLASAVFFLLVAATLDSCSKNEETPGAKDQLIMGQWVINRIQQKVYSGNTLIKDTVFTQNPNPINRVVFDAGASFAYQYNTTGTQTGGYTIVGPDSVICTAGSNTYRWKMLTLVAKLFTTENTSFNDPDYPGYKVMTYYTFIK